MSITVTVLYDGPDPSGEFQLGISESSEDNSTKSSYLFVLDYNKILDLNTKVTTAIENFNANEGGV